jgi:hypothetical protein
LQLVSVEAPSLASGHGRAVTPTRIRVAEPLAFLASLADVALTVRKRGEVGGIYRYVTSKIRVLLPERSGAGIEASLKRRPVLAQLPGEAVTSPHARTVAERGLQARMLRDQSGYPRPSGQRELKDPGNSGGSEARRCPGGRRCSSDGETEKVPR